MPNETETVSLAQFIEDLGITSTAKQIDANPNMAVDKWSQTASHYRVTLRNGSRRMTIPFSMGSAHTNTPGADDVLNALASDSGSIENARTFQEWCDALGYAVDSRTAERTYKVCQRQAAKLKQFLGDAAYATLLWNVEGL